MQNITHNWKEIKAILSMNFVTKKDAIQMLSEIREDDERAEAEADRHEYEQDL